MAKFRQIWSHWRHEATKQEWCGLTDCFNELLVTSREYNEVGKKPKVIKILHNLILSMVSVTSCGNKN